MSGPFLETSSRKRRREVYRRRRRRRRRGALVVLLLAVALALFVFVSGADQSGGGAGRPPRADGGTAVASSPDAPVGQTALGPLALQVDLGAPDRIRVPFKRPPRAGLLVNLDTGEVLWRRRPTRVLPIASVTKMMTALVTVEHLRPDDKALITKKVLDYTGSGVGVLPRNKRVTVETLLYGLLLPSGNDAARALAIRVAGSLSGMVRLMNRRAGEMGLRCTHYTSVEGLSPGNRSCPADLAIIARRLLDTPRLAKIVRTRQAIRPMQIKGGKAYFYNHNPLLMSGYPGVIGVKTGFTDEAGRCLVAAARRRGVRLAAILLDSRDPGGQARKLLDRGFRAIS